MLSDIRVRRKVIHGLPRAAAEPGNVHQKRGALAFAVGSQACHWDSDVGSAPARNYNGSLLDSDLFERRSQHFAGKHQSHLAISSPVALQEHGD